MYTLPALSVIGYAGLGGIVLGVACREMGSQIKPGAGATRAAV